MVAKRKFIDWDSIEPLYRAGSLSLNNICAQYEADHVNSQTWKRTVHHTAIIKRAKAKKWTRNLAGKVRDRIKEKLVTSSVTTCDQKNTLTDQQIIDRAAEEGSSVVLRHRTEIKALLSIEDDLLKELADGPKKLRFASYQGEIFSKEVGLTVTEKSSTLKNLAEVRAKRIALEREAHNLNDDGGSSGNGILLKQMIGAMPASVQVLVKEKLLEGDV